MVEEMETQKVFRKTEIGFIPSDWCLSSISKIFNVTAGGDFKRNESANYKNEKYPYPIYSNSLTNTGLYGYSSYYTSEANCITITARGTIGCANYRDHRFTAVGRVLVLIPKNRNDVDCFFVSEFINNRIKFILEVTGVPQLTAPQVSKYLVAHPPTKTEQTAIAAALNDADALIIQLEKIIAKKRAIKQGAMQELLTGKMRVNDLKDSWHEIELKNIVNHFIVPMRDKPKKFSGAIPWCRIEDFEGKYLYDSKNGRCVDNETIALMNLKVFPSNTLIVSCSADLGKCAILKRPLVTNQTFIGLVVNENNASVEFLYYFMIFNSEKLNQLSSGTTIAYLSREQFETFKVFIPRTKQEQTNIAQILSDMDVEIETLEKKLKKYGMMKQGMMQNLLTGKIRIV